MSHQMLEPQDNSSVAFLPVRDVFVRLPQTPSVVQAAEHPVLALLDAGTRDKLLASGTSRTLEAGETLAINGCVTFVQEGLLGAMAGPSGVCVSVVGAGAVVGLESGFDAPHRGPVVAFAASRVFAAPVAVLIEGLGRARVMELCMRQSLERLNAMESEAACNAAHLVPQRLAKWLVRLYRANQERDIHLTQAELARLIGVQRTSVNAAARQLQLTGAARFTRGRIVVHDLDRLTRAACACSA